MQENIAEIIKEFENIENGCALVIYRPEADRPYLGGLLRSIGKTAGGIRVSFFSFIQLEGSQIEPNFTRLFLPKHKVVGKTTDDDRYILFKNPCRIAMGIKNTQLYIMSADGNIIVSKEPYDVEGIKRLLRENTA